MSTLEDVTAADRVADVACHLQRFERDAAATGHAARRLGPAMQWSMDAQTGRPVCHWVLALGD